jgi:hypothetical protein
MQIGWKKLSITLKRMVQVAAGENPHRFRFCDGNPAQGF